MASFKRPGFLRTGGKKERMAAGNSPGDSRACRVARSRLIMTSRRNKPSSGSLVICSRNSALPTFCTCVFAVAVAVAVSVGGSGVTVAEAGAVGGAVALAGGRIDAIFFCPHAAEADCRCRKPKPGMLEDIAARFNADASASGEWQP